MSTSFKKVFKRFDNNLPDSDIANIIDDKRISFLMSVITIFNQYTRIGEENYIKPDYDNEIINEDLSEDDLNLFGKLMFKEYLKQELQKINKLINITSDAFRITGNQDRVKTLKEFIADTEIEINQFLSRYV